MTNSTLITIAILVIVVLLILALFPKKAYINKQNELVMQFVLGNKRVIPLAETTDYEMPHDHLIRTLGMSLGSIHTGYFLNTRTKQNLYLFLSGKGERKCFKYKELIYIVDNITTE